MSTSPRRYDEKELTRILQDAAALQASDSSSSKSTFDFSLEDVERLATEVGVDPKYVTRAASQLGDTSERQKYYLSGAPSKDEVDRTLSGTLEEDAWADLVGELRAKFGVGGETSVAGSRYEWTGLGLWFVSYVSITSKDGQSRFRLSIRNSNLRAIYFLAMEVALGLLLLGEGFYGLNIPYGKHHPSTIQYGIVLVPLVALVHLFVHKAIVKARQAQLQFAYDLMEQASKSLKSNLAAPLRALQTEDQPLQSLLD